jgi:tetratricopeptide (TPR) repeat protein
MMLKMTDTRSAMGKSWIAWAGVLAACSVCANGKAAIKSIGLDRLFGVYDALEAAGDSTEVWGFVEDAGGHRSEMVKRTVPLSIQPWSSFLAAGAEALRQGRLADALGMFQGAASRFRLPPTDGAVTWLMVGAIHTSMNALVEAERAFDQAASSVLVGASPLAHLPQFALGALAARRGELDRAAQFHERALFYEPRFLPSLYALAALRLVQGDTEEATWFLESTCEAIEEAMGADHAQGVRCLAKEQYPTMRKVSQHTGTRPRWRRSREESLALDSMPQLQALALAALAPSPILPPLVVPASLRREAPNASHVLQVTAAFLWALPRLERSQDLWALHMNIGRSLQEAGTFEAAMAHLSRAESLAPAHEAQWISLYRVLALPLVFHSEQDALDQRSALVSRVRETFHGAFPVGDPSLLRELYASLYMLPLFGRPHKRLSTDIASLFRRATAHNVAFVSPEMQLRALVQRPAMSRPKRTGALSLEARVEQALKRVGGTILKGKVVRVGLLTYQLVDSPTGHLVRRLIDAMTAYESRLQQWLLGHLETGSERWLDRLQLWLQGEEQLTMEQLLSDPASLAQQVLPKFRLQSAKEALRAPPSVWGDSRLRLSEEASPAPVMVRGVRRFEPVLVVARPQGDKVTQKVVNSVGSMVVRLWGGTHYRERNLTVAQQALAGAHLDVLVVADNEIDPLVATLLQARVCPSQVYVPGYGSGHLGTTGLPDSIDAAVAADDELLDHAPGSLAEQLVRVGEIGTYFHLPALVSQQEMFNASAGIGMFARFHHVTIPRFLLFWSPKMDRLVRRVLELDPAAVVIGLYEPQQTVWLEKTKNRLANSLGESLAGRVRFVQRMERRRLFGLLAASVAVLDTFPVGMGVLAMECASIGAPVVSIPSEQRVRSPSAAVARRLGLEQHLVGGSIEAAAELTVKLATDVSHRRWVRSVLLRQSEQLEWTDDEWIPPRNLTVPEDHVFGDIAKTVSLPPGRHEVNATLGEWLQLLGRMGR